jgi:Ring finger domain
MIPISACTSDYLVQAKRDQAEAAVLYNYTSMSNMPSTSLTSTFSVFNNPIYGITSDDAQPLLQNMVSYAGNMSTVPMGSNLSALYDPEDYVRLTLTINTGQGSSLPGLWLFLLVILAALGLIIASTSISMHVSQYRARRDLRRRIAAGEIDLESLGIKRLTVPKEMIDTMPITIYGVSAPKPLKAKGTFDSKYEHSRKSSKSDRNSTTSDDRSAAPSPTAPTHSSAESTTVDPIQSAPPSLDGFDQSSCAICLDDYVINTTPVRHLPCNHIYHPHCIDPFLQTRSSLCPLCKRSVLPKGFIPPTLQLTNATVARERRIRLMRQRASQTQTTPTDPSTLEAGVEMNDLNATTQDVHENAPARTNIVAPSQEDEDAELRRRPWIRRAMDTVFPRFTAAGSLRNLRRNSMTPRVPSGRRSF